MTLNTIITYLKKYEGCAVVNLVRYHIFETLSWKYNYINIKQLRCIIYQTTIITKIIIFFVHKVLRMYAMSVYTFIFIKIIYSISNKRNFQY